MCKTTHPPVVISNREPCRSPADTGFKTNHFLVEVTVSIHYCSLAGDAIESPTYFPGNVATQHHRAHMTLRNSYPHK